MDQVRQVMAALGAELGPDILAQCRALFDAEQSMLATQIAAIRSDIVYGSHERHRLDLYRPQGGGLAPVLIFVHGGGFLNGDKGGGDAWPNANVGRMAAQAGFLGVVINYRLAPDNVWPAGAEDIASVIDWLRDNGAQHGGDPERIVLMGTSAGTVHVAGYLKLVGDSAIRGAILLSGLYGYTALDARDMLYYGEQSLYPDRMPLEAVADTGLPLFLACAEFDPPRFQAEFLSLMQDRLARHGAMPRAFIHSGHNHYSMAMHLGTADRRLSEEICAFVRETTA